MFYVKTLLGANTAIVTEITDENVFTRCPDCGAEICIDLNDVIDKDGQLDLYGLGVCCPECSRARWKAAHTKCEGSACYQNERVADAIYKARCLKTLQALGLPTEGWICEWIEDTDEPEEVCELCSCSRVRFLHHMRHPAVADSIAVGCLCDGIMSGDELGAVARERETRNRAKRRQNFIHGEWAQEFAGLHAIRWKKKLRNGPVCLIQQDSSGRYSVWHNNHWCYRCRGKPITTFAQAASALFTVNDPKRNTL